jgi:hypothetical protein
MDTESAHLIDAWHDFYVMLGTSSPALVGLLFVATSLHKPTCCEPPRAGHLLDGDE